MKMKIATITMMVYFLNTPIVWAQIVRSQLIGYEVVSHIR
jgi:hypothetical protein